MDVKSISYRNIMCGCYDIKLLFFLFPIFLNLSFAVRLSCKDENNRPVDWFLNYKLPKLEKGHNGTYISTGKAYSYILSSSPGNWTMSSQNITSETSMLGKTLKAFYNNKKTTTYLLYNDEVPAGYNGTANGHLKGAVVFNGKTGFWIVHSIPKFTGIDGYNYPSTALEYGQSILCVTFKANALNEICKQLLFCNPNIYAKGITKAVNKLLDKKSRSLFSNKPEFIRTPPFTRISPLKSLNRQAFMSFAKDGQYKNDIYEALIAPSLKTSLATETWRRGSGTYLPASCDSEYKVLDISMIKMKATSRNGIGSYSFKSTEDHSKWAVSINASDNWICVGDMNRMASQEKRGGGALCFQSNPVRNAYRSLISDSDHCPV